MQTQYEVASLDAVDPVLREHYAGTESGSFRLDVTGLEGVEEMRAQKDIARDGKNVAFARIIELERLALEPPPELEPMPDTRHPRDVELEAEHERKVSEYEAGLKAQITSLREDRNRVALERVAVEVAGKLNPACIELLRPHILQRLVASDVGGVFSVTAKDLPTLDHLAEQFRLDARFAPAIAGRSATDQARHQQRVNETLGTVQAPASITRAQFQALTPDKRSAHAARGGKISDG